MKLLLSALALILAGCTMPGPSLPLADRQFIYVEPTKAPKATAFTLAQAYIAKTYVDSNTVLKVQDAAAGRLIGHIVLDCPEMKGFMEASAAASFNIEVEAKDQKVRLTLEATDSTRHGIDGQPLGARNISSKDDVTNVKKCADREKTKLFDAINGGGGKSENW